MNTSGIDNEHPPTEGAYGDVVSASGAARLLKVGRSTIQRRLAGGSFPSAVKGADGWVIPVEELLAAKIGPGAERIGRAAASELRDSHSLAHDLRIARLQTEVESVRRTAAEQLATERARHVEHLRSVVDALLLHRPPASRSQ